MAWETGYSRACRTTILHGARRDRERERIVGDLQRCLRSGRGKSARADQSAHRTKEAVRVRIPSSVYGALDPLFSSLTKERQKESEVVVTRNNKGG